MREEIQAVIDGLKNCGCGAGRIHSGMDKTYLIIFLSSSSIVFFIISSVSFRLLFTALEKKRLGFLKLVPFVIARANN